METPSQLQRFIFAVGETSVMPWVVMFLSIREEASAATLPYRFLVGGLWLAYTVGYSFWHRT